MSKKRALRASSARGRRLHKLYGARHKVVDIQPGDTMVLETEAHLTRDQIECVRATVKRAALAAECVVLCGGVRLAGVARADLYAEIENQSGYSSMAEWEIPNL